MSYIIIIIIGWLGMKMHRPGHLDDSTIMYMIIFGCIGESTFYYADVAN